MGGLGRAEIGKSEQVCACAQVAKEELGEGIWFEVDALQRLGGERDGLEVVLAAGGVGELRASAVRGAGGPGEGAGEVEVLAVAVAAVENEEEAVDLRGRRDFLPQLAGQRGLQALAGLHAAAGQYPVGVLAGADPPD